MSKRIVTVSREFGSGGRAIAMRVAKELGYAFYDRTLIDAEVQKSRQTPEAMKELEERLNESMLFQFAVTGSYPENFWGDYMIPPPDALFVMQEKVIKALVEKSPCVIVGTGADFILRDRKDCCSAFFYADLESRIERVVSEYGVDPKDAKAKIHRRDRTRADHYEECTSLRWSDPRNYDLCLNTGTLGEDVAAEMLLAAVQV